MEKRLIRIIISAILGGLGLLLRSSSLEISFILFLISYIIVGYDIIFKSIKHIKNGNVFDENFLMSLATIGAFIIGEYPEGVAVMLFYQIGEFFQDYAVDKSRKSIADLMDIRPDYAHVKRDGIIVKVDPDEVEVGEIIIIKPGEKVPLDSRIIEGYSTVDVSALSGESIPLDIKPGDNILSASININGLLTAEVLTEYDESTVSKILDLVENASSKKSESEKFITKFARYYTPIVVIFAFLLAFIPPLLITNASMSEWVYRAIAFLVVSCPCALVVSVPLSFFGGIGGASKKGILIKGSNYMETLAQISTTVFDKTGTLTKGVFKVQEVKAYNISEDELIELAAHVEYYSNHPIAESIKKYYGKEIIKDRISDIEEIPGHGIIALVDNRKVYAGNDKLMDKMGIDFKAPDLVGTIIHVAIDDEYSGYILIADELKSDSAKAINDLKNGKMRHIALLTGDNYKVAKEVSDRLKIEEIYTELLPADKVSIIEGMIGKPDIYGKVAFVGDGINDAPVLTRSDIGIAMGGLGSDAAIEAADIVIMTDEPSKISTAIKISKNTLNIAKQNTIFAIGIKVLVLILSALGLASLWLAIFADVGVTVIAVFNSLRTLRSDNI
ncbi:MAG: cadmium-translocating P-type ATPase [Clostridiales bacterium]|nr:cadmium-translocating P-type ATPase [Clostridiales bacterium]